MKKPQVRVGIVGAGFIADYHAEAIRRTPGTDLAAVCDINLARAEAFAASHGSPSCFTSLLEMLAREHLDVLHVLTPPDEHFAAADAALRMGVHVLLEKPMCADLESCDALLELASRQGLKIGVNQNTLFYSAYDRFRRDIRQGICGQLDHVTITWHCELPFLAGGPFDHWALRDPRHIMLEAGAHVVGHVLDLIGPLVNIAVRVSDPIILPRKKQFCRRWQVSGYCGGTAVDLRFSFAPGFADRRIEIRGTLGVATVDLENNTYVLQRTTPYGPDFDRYQRLVGVARTLRSQARRNLKDYVLAKLHLSDRGNAFGHSIAQCVRAFYASVNTSSDERNTGTFGRAIVEQCLRIGCAAPIERPAPSASPVASQASRKAEVLVIGGTGFIGRELVRQLLQSGVSVRVLTRAMGHSPFDPGIPGLEVSVGGLQSESEVDRALQGMRCVFHLARATAKTWPSYYEHDVLVTKRIAEGCLRNGVQRVIYTGTIASYYAGAKAGVITEETPLDPDIHRRDNYARAKAVSEQLLMDLFHRRKLPIVIFRPGIVVGKGGATCHWGVGMWSGAGLCRLWGDGRNRLPFVLVEDVAKALVAGMNTPGIEGESFNLAADPCLSSVEFLDELQHYAGIKLQVFPTPIWRYYAADMLKWIVKVLVGHPGRRRPSYRDWETRTAKAIFDCTKAKAILGWQPVSDRNSLISRGICLPYDERSNRLTARCISSLSVAEEGVIS